MDFTNPHLPEEKLNKIIKRNRFEQIEDKLNNFENLPYALQTNNYKNILIKNKISIADQPLTEFTNKLYLPIQEYPKINFTGLILGVDGRSLRQIEQETRSRIYIKGLEKDQCTEPVHCHIISEDIHSLTKAKNILNGIVEEAIFKRTFKTTQPKELSVWAKFYMWWFYHNKNNAFN